MAVRVGWGGHGAWSPVREGHGACVIGPPGRAAWRRRWGGVGRARPETGAGGRAGGASSGRGSARRGRRRSAPRRAGWRRGSRWPAVFSFGKATQVTPAAAAARTPSGLSSTATRGAGSSSRRPQRERVRGGVGLGVSTWSDATMTSKSSGLDVRGRARRAARATLSGEVVVTRPAFQPRLLAACTRRRTPGRGPGRPGAGFCWKIPDLVACTACGVDVSPRASASAAMRARPPAWSSMHGSRRGPTASPARARAKASVERGALQSRRCRRRVLMEPNRSAVTRAFPSLPAPWYRRAELRVTAMGRPKRSPWSRSAARPGWRAAPAPR